MNLNRSNRDLSIASVTPLKHWTTEAAAAAAQQHANTNKLQNPDMVHN